MTAYIKESLSTPKNQRAFTLIEVIFVISIIVVAYAYAIPQFNLATGTETATKLGRLSADVRSAFDTAVLSGKPHRIVFVLATGDYWLEVANRDRVYFGDDKLGHDPTEEEEKEQQEIFEEQFREFEDLAGEEITNPETDKPIKPTSPLVQQKKALEPTKWTRIESLEWNVRNIGPYLMFQDMQFEHHGRKQSLENNGEKARAMLYFFPRGYVEKGGIHIAFTKGPKEIDDTKEPFTLTTNPYVGTAAIVSGYEEIEFDD